MKYPWTIKWPTNCDLYLSEDNQMAKYGKMQLAFQNAMALACGFAITQVFGHPSSSRGMEVACEAQIFFYLPSLHT